MEKTRDTLVIDVGAKLSKRLIDDIPGVKIMKVRPAISEYDKNHWAKAFSRHPEAEEVDDDLFRINRKVSWF